jgi:hypothetical protein
MDTSYVSVMEDGEKSDVSEKLKMLLQTSSQAAYVKDKKYFHLQQEVHIRQLHILRKLKMSISTA